MDLNAGRSYQMSPNTSIKFFAGPEYVKLDRDLDVFYSGAAVPTLNVHQHTDFNGWGARFGTEAAWSLFHGLSLKGGLIGSGVYGDVSSQMFEQGAAAGDRRIVQSDQIFVPILRADAGVNWAWDINPSLSLSLYAGYEFQQFFGIPLSNRFIDDVADGLSLEQETDISLSGWVFRAGLEF